MDHDELYKDATQTYGAALDRLARGYESDPDKRRDLLQEIHFELWQSFKSYQARCSIRTWVYRIAHNTAASHIVRQRRYKLQNLSGLEDIDTVADPRDHGRKIEERIALERLYELIHGLKPLDRQLMLLYLEGMNSESIGEITGISAGNVRIQIHRIKTILTERFHLGGEL